MKRALLLAAVLACGPCEHERTHWQHGDSDSSRDCFRDCVKAMRWDQREECFALCPEADPKVTCERGW